MRGKEACKCQGKQPFQHVFYFKDELLLFTGQPGNNIVSKWLREASNSLKKYQTRLILKIKWAGGPVNYGFKNQRKAFFTFKIIFLCF